MHDYFVIDMNAVWKIATEEMPLLRGQVIAILAADFREESNLTPP